MELTAQHLQVVLHMRRRKYSPWSFRMVALPRAIAEKQSCMVFSITQEKVALSFTV
jgi:hypothetical protein